MQVFLGNRRLITVVELFCGSTTRRALEKERVWRSPFSLLECLILDVTYIISTHSPVPVLYWCMTNNYNLEAYNNDNICFAHKFAIWIGLCGSLSVFHWCPLGWLEDWGLESLANSPTIAKTGVCLYISYGCSQHTYSGLSAARLTASGHGDCVSRASILRTLSRSYITFYKLAW